MHANSDNLVAAGDINLGHRHGLPKHLGHEWQGGILFYHSEEPASLLRLGGGVRGRLIDEFIPVFRGELRRLFRFRFHRP